MSRHRYEFRALRGDYLRAGAGLALSAGALWASKFSGLTAWLFAPAGAVFVLFALRTLLRNATIYELTDQGLARSYALGFGEAARVLEWKGLERFTLRFFPAKRDRSDGWMELTLVGKRARMRLDSTLGGFNAVIRAAARAAAARRIALSDTTQSNLAALGIVPQADSGNEIVTGGPDTPARP